MSALTNTLAGVFVMFMTVSYRVFLRTAINYIANRTNKKKQRVLIIGAGEATSQIINNMKNHIRLIDTVTRTKRTESEIKKYWWSNGDTPIKKDDHAMDELRYYLCTKPDIPRLPNLKSAITKDKEKLYRQLKKGRWRQ